MRERTLHVEKLEDRTMLSADWPLGVGYAYDIAIDGGSGLTSRGHEADEALGLRDLNLLTGSVARTREFFTGDASDHNGALLYPDGALRVPTLYINGGSATTHGIRLGESGRQAIRDFWAKGGDIGGSCAGAFIMRDTASQYLGIWAGDMGGNGGRSGYMNVRFDPNGDNPLEQNIAKYVGSSVVYSIPHYYGPVFKDTYRHPEGTEFIGDIVYASRAIRKSQGTEYFIYHEEGDSVAILQPSHPEYYRSGSKLKLQMAVQQTLWENQGEPAIQGSLEFESTVEGVTGDKQYHRYRFVVDDQERPVSLRLDGVGEMFISRNGVAHAGYYDWTGDTVNLEAPRSGVYEVSVFGDHNLLNGAGYSLTLSHDVIEVPEVKSPVNWTWGFDALPTQGWEYYSSTASGRIASINGKMRMDTTKVGYNLNEAVVTLNLDGLTGVKIAWDQFWINDEYHRMPSTFRGHVNADGVAYSTDGITWTKFAHGNGHRVLDLDALGINPGERFQLKFQQYDNYWAQYDGRAWDNLRVTSR